MFEGIMRGIGDAIKSMRGKGRITEANVQEGLKQETIKDFERRVSLARSDQERCKDRLEWSVTVDDPSTWTRPWTFAMPLVKNDAEAILDAQWASASAPSAAIEMAACADTSTTFGGLIAIQNLINASAPPPRPVPELYCHPKFAT